MVPDHDNGFVTPAEHRRAPRTLEGILIPRRTPQGPQTMAELPDRDTAFMDWYLEVVEQAELTDKRYGVKGLNVWPTYGLRARRLLDRVIVREIERSGSLPVEFPTLISQVEFEKEREHIKGFDTQVYWVTKGGAADLDVPLVLRPTSETAMYPVFAVWIRSHRDLPLNVYQIVNTFRYETKTTRPFLRVREIHFFEEHSCQLDEAGATDRVHANLAAFAEMAGALALPYLPVQRPPWDKFPGAHYSIALDIPLPNGRTLQIGSIHHYRENFSRPFGIQYEDAAGAQRFAHQTTFGISERVLGAVVAVHGDRRGVVLPTSMAPHEVVIVPIPARGDGADPTVHARQLLERLRAAGRRVRLDDRDDRPGAKYYHWELRGVPVRLEVGAREAAGGGASAVDRLGGRLALAGPTLEAELAALLDDFDRRLAERARAAFAASFAPARTLEDLRASDKVRYFPWCGAEACGHQIEEAIDGALLGSSLDPPPGASGAPGACVACGSPGQPQWAVAGRPL